MVMQVAMLSMGVGSIFFGVYIKDIHLITVGHIWLAGSMIAGQLGGVCT